MTAIRAVQGDVNDIRILTLSGVEDLTTVDTVVAKVWKRGVDAEELDATVLDATDRTISITLGGVSGWLATADPGVYQLEQEVTFDDGTVLTWPDGLPDTVTVRVDAATAVP